MEKLHSKLQPEFEKNKPLSRVDPSVMISLGSMETLELFQKL